MSSEQQKNENDSANPEKVEKREEDVKPPETTRKLRKLSSIKIPDIKPAYLIYEEYAKGLSGIKVSTTKDKLLEAHLSTESILDTELGMDEKIADLQEQFSISSLLDTENESQHSLTEGRASSVSIPLTLTDQESLTEEEITSASNLGVNINSTDNITDEQEQEEEQEQEQEEEQEQEQEEEQASTSSIPKTKKSSSHKPRRRKLDDETIGQMALREIRDELIANPDAIEYVTAFFKKLIAESEVTEEETNNYSSAKEAEKEQRKKLDDAVDEIVEVVDKVLEKFAKKDE